MNYEYQKYCANKWNKQVTELATMSPTHIKLTIDPNEYIEWLIRASYTLKTIVWKACVQTL